MFQMDIVICNFRAEETAGEPPQNQQRNVGYRALQFRPGDAVQITVFPDTSNFLHNIFPIDGKGYIFLPIVGRVQISAMNETEFLNYLNQNYTQYLRGPNNIQARPMIRASLLGGFARPDLYYIDPNLSLWDLVKLGGGPLREDGLKEMRWERNRETVESNLIPLYQSSNSLSEIGFRSGDQIWTPTPDLPSFWDNFVSYIVPLGTLALTFYTVWYTTQFTARLR
jgi:protein involved in polysaccharide export with SLBB domain